jgi:hypothetical protein
MNYIRFDETNYLWNSGTVYVYINNISVESIFVDDSDLSSDEIIELLKEKYNITTVKYTNFYNIK